MNKYNSISSFGQIFLYGAGQVFVVKFEKLVILSFFVRLFSSTDVQRHVCETNFS